MGKYISAVTTLSVSPPSSLCIAYGGKWILRLRKGLSSRIWENLLLFLVGEEICGAVCSIRNQVDNLGTTNRIRDTLRRVLNLPVNAVLEYKRHDDCLKDQSSYRHTNLDLIRR
uniref:Uncharacterized protein n=1 Tax=Parascaris equorum TaxID=6256 RepID=A0A914RIY5_PAREQ